MAWGAGSSGARGDACACGGGDEGRCGAAHSRLCIKRKHCSPSGWCSLQYKKMGGMEQGMGENGRRGWQAGSAGLAPRGKLPSVRRRWRQGAFRGGGVVLGVDSTIGVLGVPGSGGRCSRRAAAGAAGWRGGACSRADGGGTRGFTGQSGRSVRSWQPPAPLPAEPPQQQRRPCGREAPAVLRGSVSVRRPQGFIQGTADATSTSNPTTPGKHHESGAAAALPRTCGSAPLPPPPAASARAG